MRKMLFFLLGFIPLTSFTQLKIKPVIQLFQSLHSKIITESTVGVGFNIPFNTGGVSLLFQYQYGGNWKSSVKHQIVDMYTLDYHLLGGEIKYRLFDQSSFYSPTLSIALSTEIHSNYKGGYLDSHGILERGYSFRPTNVAQDGELGGPTVGNNKWYSYYYISTPLISSFSIGNEFRVIEGLYVNLDIGISFRSIKVGYKEWHKSDPEPEPNYIPISTENDRIMMFDLELGLRYVFSLGK
ncbi:hypothetical protein [Brumimicrobium aurantiacum]|uniref:Outer membrane protein beta-barrel domain-containing protein n=1 Tax=Brumimicrobium aurantiacum TaxID=1737063 RepID=A0A3E1EUD2_9FLAO|nr:hypothetical protein [Brumimicrobium aurantiacum]RFC53093.1 hypothetical protein DXU93_14865 [Brumimicrobium aurantiacum]